MKLNIGLIFLLAVPFCCNAQSAPQNISPAQLQALIDLPIQQHNKQRETYKASLKPAYERQTASGEDCKTEAAQGQQPYNIYLGKVEERADDDYAIFYNNLQLLCLSQDQLRTLQASEKAWRAYLETMAAATHASWPEGTGAPGFATEVHIVLVRNRMRELHKVYGLNISQ